MNRRTNPGFGFRPSRSARLTDAAWTRTSTWPSDGVGRWTSRISTTSGGPYRSVYAAFIWTSAMELMLAERGASPPWYDRLLFGAAQRDISMPAALVVDGSRRIVFAHRSTRVD